MNKNGTVEREICASKVAARRATVPLRCWRRLWHEQSTVTEKRCCLEEFLLFCRFPLFFLHFYPFKCKKKQNSQRKKHKKCVFTDFLRCHSFSCHCPRNSNGVFSCRTKWVQIGRLKHFFLFFFFAIIR